MTKQAMLTRAAGFASHVRAAGGIVGLLLAVLSCAPPRPSPSGTVYDVVIRGGTIYDGLGGAPYVGDVGILGDKIRLVGNFSIPKPKREIDARGMAVAPGFINMLSWATESLIEDGRSQGDIRQGVTLEVMGEGSSMGPLTDTMRKEMIAEEGDIKYDVPWTTLGEYLDFLVQKGISPNVASFVGATSLRVHEIGYADRPPTPAELQRMQALARQAMEEGALGIGSSIIYAPAFYAKTDELVALSKAVAPYGGMY
ncbi:MAG: D-aminoacylase, partial [Gemmatimonadaceae bacterium]